MGKLKLLEEIGYPLDGISITMNDLNIDFINKEFILSLKKLGFIGLATDIDLVNSKNCNKDIDFYVDKLLYIYQLCKENGMVNFGSWSLIYSNLVNQEDDEPITYCKAQSGRNISVNPEGNIFVCGYSVSKIGTLKNIHELFMDNSPYVNLIASNLPGNQEKCLDCELEGICAGQCLVTNEFNQNKEKDNKKLDFLCKFYIKCTSRMLDIKLKSELSII